MHARTGRPGEAGQGLAEYGILVVIIAVAAIASLLVIGGGIKDLLSLVGSRL